LVWCHICDVDLFAFDGPAGLLFSALVLAVMHSSGLFCLLVVLLGFGRFGRILLQFFNIAGGVQVALWDANP
jgi:hypothetical protein